mmetsp:Transcript_11885/g.35692  ORF Transcript_11885/g.35692 Transcript_11885/m.35692 type:complete len:212 (+) Transcript_11885:28-663(+)
MLGRGRGVEVGVGDAVRRGADGRRELVAVGREAARGRGGQWGELLEATPGRVVVAARPEARARGGRGEDGAALEDTAAGGARALEAVARPLAGHLLEELDATPRTEVLAWREGLVVRVGRRRRHAPVVMKYGFVVERERVVAAEVVPALEGLDGGRDGVPERRREALDRRVVRRRRPRADLPGDDLGSRAPAVLREHPEPQREDRVVSRGG